MTENQESDLELIAAANAGDEKAFAALYFRYRQWVADLAFRMTGDRELALDVMQEAFLYLLKKFPGFTLRCQMKSFLYPVVKNLSLTHLSRSRRYVSGEELFSSLEAPFPANDSTADLHKTVAKLPIAQREVVILRFIEGLDLKEIAAALDVPLGTVKSRLHHALESLRNNPDMRQYFE